MTLLLVRHAEAVPRAGWSASDVLRPLSAKGRRQATGLVDLLGDRVPLARMVASPSLRCIETLSPLAAVLGLTIEVSATLAEGAEPDAAVLLARTAAGADGAEGFDRADGALVLCSHGDLIPQLLEVLQAAHDVDLGRSPRCQKGSTWQFEGKHGRFTTATYLPPP